MALSPAQEESIRFTLNELLTFATDKTTLQTQIAELIKALKNEVDDSHPYFRLGQCFVNPQSTFLRLEDQGSNTKLGEVRHYVAQYLLQQLQQAATIAHLDLSTHINLSTILSLIPQSQYVAPFQSEKMAIDSGSHPYELEIEEGKIYKASLKIPMDIDRELNVYDLTPAFDLHIDVEYPPTVFTPLVVRNFEPFPVLSSDSEEDAFMEKLKKDAKAFAEKEVAKIIVSDLSKLYYLNSKTKEALIYSPINRLLAHRFYTQLLKNHPTLIPDLIPLDDQQADILLSPLAMRLIENSLCSIKKAKTLTPWGIQVLSNHYYYSLLQEDANKLDTLGFITESQGKLLLLPPMLKLAANKKIALREAMRLPSCIKPLLLSPTYMAYFMNMKGSINWWRLRKINEADVRFFTKPTIRELVTNHNMDLTRLMGISPVLANESGEKIAYLLGNQYATVDQLNKLLPEDIALIESHPTLYLWIKKGILAPGEIDAQNISFLHTRVYARRLFTIYLKEEDNLEDLDKLMQEIPDAAQYCNMPIANFRNEIVDLLLLKIQHELSDKLKTETNNSFRGLYQTMINKIIEAQNASSANPTITLLEVAMIATEGFDQLIRKRFLNKPDKNGSQLYANVVLFSQSNTPEKNLKLMYEQLNELCKICDVGNSKKLYL